jgi:hypothetical protein
MAKDRIAEKTTRAGALLARVWPGSPPEPCWGGLLPVLGIWWVIWLTTAGSTGRCLCTKIDSYRYRRPSWVVATSPMGGSGRTPPSRVWPTTGCASATATGSGRRRNCRNVGRLSWHGL